MPSTRISQVSASLADREFIGRCKWCGRAQYKANYPTASDLVAFLVTDYCPDCQHRIATPDEMAWADEYLPAQVAALEVF